MLQTPVAELPPPVAENDNTLTVPEREPRVRTPTALAFSAFDLHITPFDKSSLYATDSHKNHLRSKADIRGTRQAG